jgi:hypothetical protein
LKHFEVLSELVCGREVKEIIEDGIFADRRGDRITLRGI